MDHDIKFFYQALLNKKNGQTGSAPSKSYKESGQEVVAAVKASCWMSY